MSTLSFSDSTARKLELTSENAADLLRRMASVEKVRSSNDKLIGADLGAPAERAADALEKMRMLFSKRIAIYQHGVLGAQANFSSTEESGSQWVKGKTGAARRVRPL